MAKHEIAVLILANTEEIYCLLKVVFDGGNKASCDKVINAMDILRRHGIQAIGVH